MKKRNNLLSPEARLALLPEKEKAEDLQEVRSLLNRKLDWEKLLHLVHREKSALPLWRTLGRAGLEASFEEARVLKHMAEIWEFKLIHMQRLLLQTLEAFDQAGIRCILLKGAAAAYTVYGDFSRRPMLDLDVLVPDEEAEAAWSLARQLEWHWDADRFPREAYGRAHHLPPLHDDFGSGAGLEIHRRISMPDNPFGLSPTEISSRASSIEVDGLALAVPAIEDQLLHCCIHFAWSHRLTSNAWRAFSDVEAVIASGRIDWAKFVRTAKTSNAETCCYWTLSIGATVVGIDPPESVLDDLRPSLSPFVMDRLKRHFIVNLLPDGKQCPSDALTRRVWKLGVRRGEGSSGIHLPSRPGRLSPGQRIGVQFRGMGRWFRYLTSVA